MYFFFLLLLFPPTFLAVPGVQNPFPSDRVLDVRIRINEKDWNELRQQTRTIGKGYAREPFGPITGRPYSWFDAHLKIDGQDLGRVGLRKKGFRGSLDQDRPSMKIDLGRVDKEKRWAGLRRLTLNNAKQDPSRIRQCLGYGLFRSLDLPAPRCALVHVHLNERDLGVYVSLETIDKRFLRRWFGKGKGVLLEGTGSDFRPRWVDTFEQKSGSLKKKQLAFLSRLRAALELPDSEMLQALKPLLELDQFISFWALNVLLAADDCYISFANNYYLYRSASTGRVSFISWGQDMLMGYTNLPNLDHPQTIVASAILPYRLCRVPGVRSRYLARMGEIVDRLWNVQVLQQEAIRLSQLARPHVPGARHREFDTQLDVILTFIEEQSPVICTELEAPDLPCPEKLLKTPTWRVTR